MGSFIDLEAFSLMIINDILADFVYDHQDCDLDSRQRS